MILFEKVTIIRGNRYDIETDESIMVLDLFKGITDINTMIILSLTYGENRYTLDLSKLLVHHALGNGTIRALIDQLTPEMIYSFGTQLFHQQKIIRSFMSHDLPGDVTISPYNIEINEMTNTVYDPSYRDIVIFCTKYDLTNVFPILGNKLRKASWNNGKICLKGNVEIAKDVDVISFLSFGSFCIDVIDLQDVTSGVRNLDSTKSYILILNGHIFYDANYIFNVSGNTLILNEDFILTLIAGFDSLEALVNDTDSFLIEVNVNNLYVRDMLITHIDEENKSFVYKYFEKFNQKNHIDYICIDNTDDTLRGLTSIDDQYRNVAIDMDVFEHHVYIHEGSTNMRLIQLSGY